MTAWGCDSIAETFTQISPSACGDLQRFFEAIDRKDSVAVLIYRTRLFSPCCDRLWSRPRRFMSSQRHTQ